MQFLKVSNRFYNLKKQPLKVHERKVKINTPSHYQNNTRRQERSHVPCWWLLPDSSMFCPWLDPALLSKNLSPGDIRGTDGTWEMRTWVLVVHPALSFRQIGLKPFDEDWGFHWRGTWWWGINLNTQPNGLKQFPYPVLLEGIHYKYLELEHSISGRAPA
jgi:hypothetical protein